MDLERFSKGNNSRLTYDKDMERVISSLMGYIEEECEITTIELTTNINSRYIGNFYGLLSFIDIEYDLWLITLKINNFNSPEDYNGETEIKIIEASDTTKEIIIKKIKQA